MLSPAALQIINAYWASFFGCPTEALFSGKPHVVIHGSALAEYAGVFALFRGERSTISLPQECPENLLHLIGASPGGAEGLAAKVRSHGFQVIGPAYVGYLEVAPDTWPPVARWLSAADAAAVAELKAACTEQEWEHGGAGVGEQPACGVFVAGRLAALAAYKAWGGGLAHISVVCHPLHRGRGLARDAVAFIAAAACHEGLVAQYRTLESNPASRGIAASLGFIEYASSVAIRLP